MCASLWPLSQQQVQSHDHVGTRCLGKAHNPVPIRDSRVEWGSAAPIWSEKLRNSSGHRGVPCTAEDHVLTARARNSEDEWVQVCDQAPQELVFEVKRGIPPHGIWLQAVDIPCDRCFPPAGGGWPLVTGRVACQYTVTSRIK